MRAGRSGDGRQLSLLGSPPLALPARIEEAAPHVEPPPLLPLPPLPDEAPPPRDVYEAAEAIPHALYAPAPEMPLEVLGEQIMLGLQHALALAELLVVETAPPLAHDAPWVDRFDRSMSASIARSTAECASLNALLLDISPASYAASKEPKEPSPRRAPSSPRERPREEHDEEGVGHTLLTERQRELLGQVTIAESGLVCGPVAKIPDWDLLKSVVETLGGRWLPATKKRTGGWRFADDVDAVELVRIARETGRVADPKVNDLYETQPALAAQVVRWLEPSPAYLFLEPNAGRGALVDALLAAVPTARVHGFELLKTNVDALKTRYASNERVIIKRADFLKLSPVEIGLQFDRVLMNPPFSRGADLAHVRHAAGFLAPGGRLVAVMSRGLRYRSTKPFADFKTFLAPYTFDLVDNADDAFAGSGTMFRTLTLILQRRN